MSASVLTLTCALLAAAPESSPRTAQPDQPSRGHGPEASADAFAHVFQVKPHMPDRPQLSFHYGLLQPILLRGFNAAIDFRYKRFVATYSHGHGLEIGRAPGTLSDAELDAGVEVFMPYTTGGGFGVVLLDELYVLADFKVHGYELRYGSETQRYQTVTVGAELGWRLFLWKGLHIAPVLRYWPTVYSSIERSGVDLGEGAVHKPIPQGISGFFANVLIGWQFGL